MFLKLQCDLKHTDGLLQVYIISLAQRWVLIQQVWRRAQEQTLKMIFTKDFDTEVRGETVLRCIQKGFGRRASGRFAEIKITSCKVESGSSW